MAQYKTLNNFANEFSTSTTYNVGDLVMYLGTLYACTTQHTGSWDASHFIQTNFKGTTSSVSVNPTLTGNEPELLGLEVDGAKYQSQKTYASDGVTFRFDAPEGITLENSFSSYNRMGKMVAFVVYCKITKSAGASNVVGIGTFSNLPNDVNDKIVGGTFVLEDKSVVYVDGTYTRVVAPSSWTKESGNRLSLSIDTTNMVNDTTYACRLLSIFLLTDNLLFDTILDNNPWDVIDMAAKAGTASNYWAVGDTKTDVGVDGNTRTFRIVNIDNDGIVFEEVGVESNTVKWDANNVNNYYQSNVRNVTLPATLLNFSNALQGLITTTNVKVAEKGNLSTILTLTDKLFLEAEKELGLTKYSRTEEQDALTTFAYWTTHTSDSDRIKYNRFNTGSIWWLRSPHKNDNGGVIYIYNNGSIDYGSSDDTNYVSPCFRLGQPQTGGLGRLFSSYSWQEIDAIAKAGNASSYFAIGDTKTDTGTDSVTRTFRIVDMNERGITMEQVGLEGTDGTGATGVVWDADNSNDYSASDMRNTVLPATLLRYSSNLQAVIAYTDVKVAENGNSTTVLTLNDKLFLEAEKEVFGSRVFSVSEEANELSQFAYYASHNTADDRKKYRAGSDSASAWWLRSSFSGSTYGVVYVSSNGAGNNSSATDTVRFSPCFRIGISDTAPARRCVISNLGSEDPTAVTFTKTGGFPIESQAWEEVVIGNDHFAKFTPWYRKSVYNNGELTGFIISDQQEDADFVPYDCFLDESGNLLPYILIGRYCCSNTTTADSTDNSMATTTPSAGRALCRAKGTGYQMMDAAMFNFWRDLALACSETVDFNNGSGVASYLGLARMTDGGWWIDGLTHIDSTYLYCSKPSKYVDEPTTSTDGYSALSYTMPTNGNYCVKALGYDANHPTMNLPSANTGATNYTVYYCDRMYYSSGNHPCLVSVGIAYAHIGLFALYGIGGWSGAGGVRLCYKPLGGNN